MVVGSEKMAVFDDTAEHKLVLYPHKVEWKNRMPTAVKADARGRRHSKIASRCGRNASISSTASSPERRRSATAPKACGSCACSMPASARCRTARVMLERLRAAEPRRRNCPTSCTSRPTSTRAPRSAHGTKIWHFSHVMKGARIGQRSIIGQNVNVDGGTIIGNNVKIQNNVSVYTGAVIEDDVFLGPSCVLTNVTQSALAGEPALAVRDHPSEARLHDRRQRHDRLRRHDRPLRVRRRRFGRDQERSGLRAGRRQSRAARSAG